MSSETTEECIGCGNKLSKIVNERRVFTISESHDASAAMNGMVKPIHVAVQMLISL